MDGKPYCIQALMLTALLLPIPTLDKVGCIQILLQTSFVLPMFAYAFHRFDAAFSNKLYLDCILDIPFD